MKMNEGSHLNQLKQKKIKTAYGRLNNGLKESKRNY